MNKVNEASPANAVSDVERVVIRLRGSLQNCVGALENAKRHSCGKQKEVYEKAIESANKALYETLGV